MTQDSPFPATEEGFVIERPTVEQTDFLADRLEEFNNGRWPDHLPWSPVGIYRREAGVITAGLVGHAYAGLMFVMYFWIEERLRGRGLGKELLQMAERYAESRGCHLIWLDTFTFQAPGFYRKCGYEQFGALGTPPYQKMFFSKHLSPT